MTTRASENLLLILQKSAFYREKQSKKQEPKEVGPSALTRGSMLCIPCRILAGSQDCSVIDGHSNTCPSQQDRELVRGGHPYVPPGTSFAEGTTGVIIIKGTVAGQLL